MLSKIIDFILFRKSLGSILGTFTKTQNELEKYISLTNAKNVKIDNKVTQLKANATINSAGVARAEAVKAKIDEMLG